MATYNEIIYSVREGIRQHTTDSDIDDRQIIFEFNLQRALWYRNEYNKKNRTVDDQIKQVLCIDLELATSDECDYESNSDCLILKSKVKLPNLLDLHDKPGIFKIITNDINSKPLSFVSYNKFPFTGNGPYNKDSLFVTLHPNNHIYVKSRNTNFNLLKSVSITAILENPLDAKQFQCNGASCFDPNKSYPVKSHIIAYIKDLVIERFIRQLQIPKDEINNSNEN